MTTTTDLKELHGRVMLVKSTRDQRNPPTAMRGWLEVHEHVGAAPEVSVVVQFPQMFTTPVHQRVFALDQAALDRLLACDGNAAFELTVDEELG